jgi:membrane-associated phospholipid phosphatase
MPQEGIILGIGLPLMYLGYRLNVDIQPPNSHELTNLSIKDVNGFDRIAAYQYSEQAADLSDIFASICLASPLALLFSQDIRRDAGIVYMMYGQSLVYGSSLSFISKGTFPRYRPFVYNADVPGHLKLNQDARRSFFSGHTSIAFTSMIFFATVLTTYYPGSQWEPYAWTGSILLASSVGYLRIIAGKHYPTDVLVGAIVGSLVGYIIPKIHKTDQTKGTYPISNPEYKKTLVNLSIAF